MAEPLVIHIEGIDDAQLETFNKLAEAIRALQTPLDTFTANMSKTSQSAGGAADQVDNIGRAASRALGPMQRLARAQEELSKAKESGDEARIFDAEHNVRRAQTAVNRAKEQADPNNLAYWAKRVLMSSRLRLPGGLNPLVGQLLSGPMSASMGGPLAALASPIGVAAAAFTAAATAVTALQQSAEVASKVLAQYGSAHFVSGGTPGQTSTGILMGRLLGQDMAQAARTYADSISGGGQAGAVAWSLGGLYDRPGMYGRVNKMQGFLKIVDAIINMPDEAKAIRLARSSPELEKVLPLRDLSPANRQRLMQDSQVAISPQQRRAAADFNFALQRMGTQWERLVTQIGAPVLSAAGAGFEAIMSSVEPLVPYLQLAAFYVQQMIKPFETLAHWAQIIGTVMNPLGGAGGQKSPEVTSRDLNTDAIDRNTREMGKMREFFGGGSRAKGAVPAKWAFDTLNEAARGKAMDVGAFQL